METMRPSGPVKLESIESGLYKEVGVTVLFNYLSCGYKSILFNLWFKHF